MVKIGREMDILARMSLWQVGLDYRHGTGHGVGAFLNVHEGILLLLLVICLFIIYYLLFVLSIVLFILFKAFTNSTKSQDLNLFHSEIHFSKFPLNLA